MVEWRLRADPAERLRRPPERAPRRRSGGSIILRGTIKALVLLLLWTAIIGGGVLGYFALTLPDTGELTRAERRPSVTVLAADGSLLATFGDLFGQPLTLREMSPYLPKAVIATEDRRFYSHFGVDPIGLLRAAVANFTAGHVVQGGSTITQQLAKNLFLTPERSLSRDNSRDTAGALARASLHQGRDPRNLSQSRLSRRRHLRRRCRGAPLFRQVSTAYQPLRECRYCGLIEGADEVQSDPRPRKGRRAYRSGPRQYGRGRHRQ